MKKFFIPAIFSVAMLASVISYGQQKNMINQAARTRVVKEPAREMPRKAFQREVVVPLKVTDPPIVNDHLDIYSENPELLKATLTVHFGNISSIQNIDIDLYSNPDYTYHGTNHLRINSYEYSGISSNNSYQIPIYTASNNHWTVTLNDFVNKWVDSAHTQLDNNYWHLKDGGSVILTANDFTGTIKKLYLVLKFATGTKTIVWKFPKTIEVYHNKFNKNFGSIKFKFDQNFNPMN